MAYEFPDGFKVLNPKPADAKLRVASLSDIFNDPTYSIGMSPIYAEDTNKHYKLTGGTAFDGWTFTELDVPNTTSEVTVSTPNEESFDGSTTQQNVNKNHKTWISNLDSNKEDDLGNPLQTDDKPVLTSDTDGQRGWIDLLSAIQPAMETLETTDSIDSFTFDFTDKPIQKVYTIDADRGFTIDIQNMPVGDIFMLNVRVCTPSTISVRFPDWTFIMNAGDGATAEVKTFPFNGFTNKVRDGVALTDYLFRSHMIVLIKHHYPKSFNINSTPGVPKVGQDYYTFHTTESGNVAFNKQ